MNCELHPEWPVAGKCSRCNKPICAKCEPNLGAAEPKCESCRARRGAAAFDVYGIGGWLLIPAIGLVLNLLSLLWAVPVSLRLMFGFGIGGTLMGLFTLAAMAVGAAAAVFFFQKKRLTPKLMIAYYGLGAMGAIIGLMTGFGIGGIRGGGVIYSFVWPAVWIPYFLLSQRVKSTFTND
ncbi:MAG: DUF2569 family protein [Myxococcaceae bacterium]